MSGGSRETYRQSSLKRCLRSVVLPDCRGPVRTTAGNSDAALLRTVSSDLVIYLRAITQLLSCNYAFRLQNCKQKMGNKKGRLKDQRLARRGVRD
jgi:hypothetical protein